MTTNLPDEATTTMQYRGDGNLRDLTTGGVTMGYLWDSGWGKYLTVTYYV